MALDESLLLDVENGSSGQEFMKAINKSLSEAIRIDNIKCEIEIGSYVGSDTGNVTINSEKFPKMIFIKSIDFKEFGFGFFNQDTYTCQFGMRYEYQRVINTNTTTLVGTTNFTMTYDENTTSISWGSSTASATTGKNYQYALIY